MAKPKILVVDSDEGFGNMLKEGLNGSGYYDAHWVQTGHEALQSLVTGPFDLVIVDMALRDIRPFPLIQAVRKIKKDMRVMMIPLLGQQLPEQAQALNINGVLSKPFFVGDLPDLIDKAVGRPRAAVPSPPLMPTSPPAAAEKSNHAGTEKAAPQPATQVEVPPPIPMIAPLPQEKMSFLRANENEIVRLLSDLNREVRAEAILLIAGQELVAHSGLLSRDQCRELSRLVAQSSQAAAQAADFLGEKAGRFAQSLHEGNEYRVYTLSLGNGVLLSVAFSSNVPLGMVRHQCRQTATQIDRFI